MQSKLLSGSQKDNHHEMRKGGCWFWLKRTRGSHRTRSKRKEFFVFTLLAIMFFTALIWSYEPHLASLSSRQEQFGLRNSATFHRVTVKQEDVLLREPHLIRAQMEERSKPLTANAENTNHETEKTPEDSSTKRWSSTVKESSSVEEKKDDREGNDPSSPFRKKGLSAANSSYDSEGSLDREKEEKDSSSLGFKKQETADKQKPIAENVQNTKLVVEEPFTSKSSSTTQGSSQSSTTTEGLSTNIGPNYVQDSLARKKEDKGSSFPTSKKEDIQDKLKPITDNVPNTELVVEETFTSKGSSTARGFSQSSVTTEGLSTNKGFDSTKEKKDKDSSSLVNKNKVDTLQPVTENVQNTTHVVDESSTSKESSKARGSSQSFATTEGLSTTKGSDGNEASLAREKEDKDSSSSMSKRKDDVAKPEERLVQEPLLVEDKETKDMPKSQVKDVEIKKPFVKESFALNNSSTNKDVLQTEKEDKVATSTYQKKEISKDMAISKDGPPLKEPLHIRKEIEDKPKVQIDNVQSGKPMTQYKSSTEESTEANGSSNTSGIIRRKKQDKVLSSTSENKECNYAKGRWVFDSKRPLYSGFKCKRWLPWIFACRLTTRPDFHFEQFRWQPENCDMPEFERHSFLERMKNKTIAFVGDSIGRQQFQSFMCMLTGGEDTPEVEDVGPEYDIRPKNMAYRFPQTNTTIIYFWSSCLCDLTPMNTSNPDAGVAMHLDRPPAFLRENLHKFDVLVLNTGHHWNRGKIKVNKWVMHVDGKPNMDKTLFTVGSAKNFTIWSIAKWVDSQLKSHPRGLKAFFRTISPRHFFGGEWNTGGSCENTTPLVHGSQVTQNESSDELVASAVKGTGVRLLDITALSALRDEGHISKYGHKANSGVRDCLHWCLPGIPDTWNEILATQI